MHRLTGFTTDSLKGKRLYAIRDGNAKGVFVPVLIPPLVMVPNPNVGF